MNPAKPSRRTNTLSVRLHPRTRYALELLARQRRATVTSVLEAAIDRLVADPAEGLFEDDKQGKRQSVLEHVWDTDEADRLVKLAMNYPNLLTYDEERAWKAIREEPSFWLGKERRPNFKAIRDRWSAIRRQYLEEAN